MSRFQTKVGLAIQDYREKNNVSQASLAEKSGMKQAEISSLESGRRNITTNIAWKLEMATQGNLKAQELMMIHVKEELEHLSGFKQ
jgi:transcriptional regulator with XRE-family HTH domain